MKREEYEVEIPPAVGDQLLTQNSPLTKCRFEFTINGHRAFLDIHNHNIPDLVEVEFDTEEDAADFIIPSWFADEVTDDKEFSSQNFWEIINDLD